MWNLNCISKDDKPETDQRGKGIGCGSQWNERASLMGMTVRTGGCDHRFFGFNMGGVGRKEKGFSLIFHPHKTTKNLRADCAIGYWQIPLLKVWPCLHDSSKVLPEVSSTSSIYQGTPMVRKPPFAPTKLAPGIDRYFGDSSSLSHVQGIKQFVFSHVQGVKRFIWGACIKLLSVYENIVDPEDTKMDKS